MFVFFKGFILYRKMIKPFFLISKACYGLFKFTYSKNYYITLNKKRMRGTFHRWKIIYGQFQILAPPEHTYCVPLIIVQILTRKNCLWTFACRTVQTAVNTHT